MKAAQAKLTSASQYQRVNEFVAHVLEVHMICMKQQSVDRTLAGLTFFD